MTRLLRPAMAFLLVLLVGLFFALPSSASATPTLNDYGPWFPAPGTAASAKTYDPSVQLFGSPGVTSIADFTCIYPAGSGGQTGSPLSAADQATLSAIFLDASQLYDATKSSPVAGDKGNTVTVGDLSGGIGTGGGSGGQEAMDAYLIHAQALLAAGGWVPLSRSSQLDQDTSDPSSAAGIDPTAGNYYNNWHSTYLKYNAVVAGGSVNGTVVEGDAPKLARDNVNWNNFKAAYQAAKTYNTAHPNAPHLTISWQDTAFGGAVTTRTAIIAGFGADYQSIYDGYKSSSTQDQQQLVADAATLKTVAAPNPALAAMIYTGVDVPLNLAAGNPHNISNAHPTGVPAAIPQGCGLNPISAANLNFIQIITDPGTFFTDLLLYIPSHLAQDGYNFLQPYAFLYTFWTPHTELGDTIFNVQTSCPLSTAASPLSDTQKQQEIDSCTSPGPGGTPLGFNKSNQNGFTTASAMPWYVSIAIFLQWLISGFYFIILFAAAVLYMMRGKKSTQLNVLTLIPKLLAAALLTIFAPSIIGALVDVSNTLVGSFFSLDSARSIGRISDILTQSNSYIGGVGSLVGQFVQVLVGLFTDFFFAIFILGSLLRQVIFMGLIIVAPLACFCLMVPRWQQQFSRYVRCLLVVIFLPAVMAFILKLGIAMNPIVTDAANHVNTTGVTGLIGLLLVMVTLWFLAKVMRLGAGIATGSPAFQKSLTGRAMGRLGELATMASMSGVGPPGLGMAGRALGAGAAVSAAGDSAMASLIPSGKGSVGSGSGAIAGGRRRLGLPGAGGSGYSAVGSAGATTTSLAQASRPRSLAQNYERFLTKKEAQRGTQRISQRRAMRYDRELSLAQSAKEQELGHRMGRGERDEFMLGSFVRDASGAVLLDRATGQKQRNNDGYAAAHGGMVEKMRGNYYLINPEEQINRPPSRARQAAGAVAGAPLAAARAADTAITGGRVAGAGAGAVSAARVARARAASAVPGAAPVRVGNIAEVHEEMMDVATRPGLHPEAQKEAADWLESHPLCPRCGGPTKNGICLNPACTDKPKAPRRRRGNVSTAKLADAPGDLVDSDKK